jgi:hypothetical protein
VPGNRHLDPSCGTGNEDAGGEEVDVVEDGAQQGLDLIAGQANVILLLSIERLPAARNGSSAMA